jgi:hypothetical protein
VPANLSKLSLTAGLTLLGVAAPHPKYEVRGEQRGGAAMKIGKEVGEGGPDERRI